jgi:hypothetical protein
MRAAADLLDVRRLTPAASTPANWPHHVLDAWHLIRQLREELRDTREVVREAVHLLRERDVELTRLRERYYLLLNDRRGKAA